MLAHGLQYFKTGDRKWKYVVGDSYSCSTGVKPNYVVMAGYYSMFPNGNLVLKRGYSWDGITGAPDYCLPQAIRASAVHDCFCQAIGNGIIHKSYRSRADKEFFKMCMEDGMNTFLACSLYAALRLYSIFK